MQHKLFSALPGFFLQKFYPAAVKQVHGMLAYESVSVLKQI